MHFLRLIVIVIVASRMDSFEMSVTSTDCQYPGCPYVASVYTYPYCHEHKTLSPYYVPGEPVGPPLGRAKQQVNDLNKDRNTKSSSLTEQSSSSSSSGGKFSFIHFACLFHGFFGMNVNVLHDDILSFTAIVPKLQLFVVNSSHLKLVHRDRYYFWTFCSSWLIWFINQRA